MEDGRGSCGHGRAPSRAPRGSQAAADTRAPTPPYTGQEGGRAAEAKQCRQLPKKRGPCVTGLGTASAGPNSAASSPGRRGPGLEPRPCVPRRPTFPRSPTARHLPRARHRAQHLPCVNSGPRQPQGSLSRWSPARRLRPVTRRRLHHSLAGRAPLTRLQSERKKGADLTRG